jgi:hypothetical protein
MKINNHLNITEELCGLLEYISDIAIEIRLNSAYRYRSLSHGINHPEDEKLVSDILFNVMEYSDVIHDFYILSESIKSNNFKEIINQCHCQIKRCDALKAYIAKNPNIDNSKRIANKADSGIRIFSSIIAKAEEAINNINSED